MQSINKILIPVSVLFFVWGTLFAQQQEPPRKKIKLPGLENGVLKIQDVPGVQEETTEEKPEIFVDNRRIRVVKRNPDGTVTLPGGGLKTIRKQKWKKETPLPPDSLAAEITGAKSPMGIQWTPLRIAGTVQGVRLPDVQLSLDQSLFAIVETTGKVEGPWGSRIILMNSHNWNIIRILTTERVITRLCFINGTQQIAALCNAQPVMKQNAGLAVFHLKSGKETAFRQLPDAVSGSMISDYNGHIYIAHREKKQVWRFEKDITQFPKTIRTNDVNPVIALSPNGKFFAVSSSSGKITLHKVSDMRPITSIKAPENYPFSQIIFIDNDKQLFCAANPLQNSSAVVLRNRQFFELNGNNAGFNAITGDGKYLIHCKKVRGEIEVINTETLVKESAVIPETVSPQTRGGDPAFVFHLEASGTIAVLDTKGNFYLLYLPKNGRKYQKETVFMPVD